MREPYVGVGVDGALRSAAIDESEADLFAVDDPRRGELLASAQRWRDQAQHLVEKSVAVAGPGGSSVGEMLAEALQPDLDPTYLDRFIDLGQPLDEILADIDWDVVARADNPLLKGEPRDDDST